MKLRITKPNSTNTIQLIGDLDIYSVEAARDELRHYVADQPALDLDLGGVETCDAAGMQLLLAVRRSSLADGKPFSIQSPAAAIEKCAELLGIRRELCQPHTH